MDIKECWLYERLADEYWRIEATYRIDEGEWTRVESLREFRFSELRIPGTSVVLVIENGRYWHSHDEDVSRVRWLE